MTTELTIALLNNELLAPFFGIKITVLVVTYLLAILTMWFAWQEKKRQTKENARLELLRFLELIRKPRSLDSISLAEEVEQFFEEASPQGQALSPTLEQLQHAWNEFKEGVEHHNGIDYNVYQAEDFFKSALIVEPVVKPLSYYATWASSSGLLFTFIALTAGLSELNYAGVGEIKGIGYFINALSGKFITSIIGLGFALGFDNAHRKASRDLKATLDDIVYGLNRSFKRLTAQHILLGIRKDVHNIPQIIDDYFNKLYGESGVIKSIEKAITEGIQGEVTKIETAIGQVPTAISNGLEPKLKEIDTNTKAIAETLGASTEDVTKGISEGINQHLVDLNKTMGALPKTIEDLVKVIGEGQGNNVEALLRTFKDEITKLMGEVTRSGGEVSGKMQESLDTLTKIVDELNKANKTATTQTGEAIKQINVGAEEASTTIKDTLKGALEKLTEAVDKFKTVGEKAPGELETAFNNFKDLLNNQFTPFVSRQDELLDKLGEHVQSIAGIQTGIQEIEGKLTKLQTDLATAYTDHNMLTKEQLDALQQSITDLKGLMSDHQARVGQLTQQYGNMDVLAQNIAKTFADSGDKMANDVENIMTISSKQYLEDFSQKHNNAIASIQAMAENIAEALADKGIQAVAPQKVMR